MKLCASLITALAFAAAGTANASILVAQDNFTGATSGTGWTAGWEFAAGTKKTPAPASLSNGSLVVVGNDDNAAVRTLAESQDADVFVDFTLQYTGGLGGNDFVGMWFGNWNGPNIGLKANCGDTKLPTTCTNDLFVRTGGTDSVFLPGSDLKAGQSYQIFGHLYKSGDKNSKQYDRFDAWFMETGTELASAVVTAKGNSNFASFEAIGLRSANIDNQVQVSIDNLRVANVPEPGSLALMGLALAGFAAVRRRQRG